MCCFLHFFTADNMNRGSRLLGDAEQKWDVAQLNLEAGEKALSASAFRSAAKYLMTGISILGPDPWEAKYSLTIRLYDAGVSIWHSLIFFMHAVAIHCSFYLLLQLRKRYLSSGTSLGFRSWPRSHYFTQLLLKTSSIYTTIWFELLLVSFVNMLKWVLLANDARTETSTLCHGVASSKFDEGISSCVKILSQLGEVIPTDISIELYVNEVAQVKQLLNGKSRQELLSLPSMANPQKLVRASPLRIVLNQCMYQ